MIAPTILMDLFPREKRARVHLGLLPGDAARRRARAQPRRLDQHEVRLAHGVLRRRRAGAARRGSRPCSCPSRSGARARGSPAQRLKEHERAGATREDYLDLMVNSSYTYSVLGMAFYTFAIGGLAFWLPTFFHIARNMPLEPGRPLARAP